ncbi:prefoldin subunit 5 [Duganella sp. 1224]|uniref:hypothetical protein n=1 Tax=Duganella sp. 1224 TaxID=2587052 RepID=UPI0015CE6918|nr:hypothetical protein [Duganella sp. 1224]NYE59223.1 prefoldin subunit 5 [Duganella sp. 1224]
MAVPLIIGGAALISGLWGAKKGYDAKKNYDEAERVVKNAVWELETSRDLLEEQKDSTASTLKSLGSLRLTTEGTQMKRFIDAIAKVNQISYRNIELDGKPVDIQAPDFKDIASRSYQAADLLKDGIGAVSSGILTGIGAGGLATQIGVASTGTAIGSLSGAAATNATLAWLGGGSLAAGGMGVAGGTAILGGAIAGPVIAVMGFSAAKKSEQALTDAFSKEAEILEANEQVRNGIAVLGHIQRRADEIQQVITAVSGRFEQVLQGAETLLLHKGKLARQLQEEAEQNKRSYLQSHWLKRLWHRLLGKTPSFAYADPFDFTLFSEEERKLYMTLTAFGYALYALLKVKVLDDDGNLTADSEAAVAQGRQLMEPA